MPIRRPKKVSSAGQQGERCGEHHQHRERGGDREPVEEADSEREHAHQRDHDGRAGEDHGPAGCVHRFLDGARDVPAVAVVRLAVAGDDEERVVDPDAQSDHQGELGGEVGHAQDPAHQPDQAESGPEPEQGGDDREAHREHRAEADQEDHDRGADADERGVADREPLRLLDRLAVQLDLKAGRARSGGRGDHPPRRGDRQDVRALVEGHGREADRPVPGDSPGPGGVGAGHGRDVREVRHPTEHPLDPRLDGMCGQRPGGGVQHDLVRVARLPGNRLESRSAARWASVPGSEKLFP